ncbi:hypothetical protein HDU78_010661 [Chytriomyces hyalinus]|uniref:Transcriptional regulatory protein RXT2 N-terminal domain-containing protein n=1 Tax=Chytriomyces confervae TaxID=246404 RepID=A0A507FMI2_9FUNG|nr:hypothetical protein BJ741DRAFT_589901 [Chytriomyces cf. hyalinus JEL632]KAJ3244655.1 hypothetical protein HDU78_010661 [Chytriomyces hyalinus]KAJ3258595.1 hypothetical protein HDU77_002226 [Chytriomyces hyalinus]KAJ3406432.1 hypothetical protein HDU80_011265 [Chytriomyces hyalinus]TPX76835.1 hypothetical protein CcCBS67573_g01886 [Chytriomyces confervae]
MAEEDYGTANFRPANRGNKLKARMAEPSTRATYKYSIMHPRLIDEQTKIEKIGKKRAITRKQRHGSHADDDLGEDSPYSGISIDEIWAPIESPEDVKNIKPHVRTLRSRQLKIMGHTLMETIETETAKNQPLVRLVDALQMDDPLLQDLDLGDMGVPSEVQREFRDVVQDCVNCNFEFLRQISMVRSKLMVAHDKKKVLAKLLVPFEPKK